MVFAVFSDIDWTNEHTDILRWREGEASGQVFTTTGLRKRAIENKGFAGAEEAKIPQNNFYLGNLG
jgi:hypothetical protein